MRSLNNEPPVGCFCFVGEKARQPDATCWARDQGLDIGWEDEING